MALEYVELLQLGSLAIITFFGLLYAKKRAVVILPGLMIGSLLSRALGLELYSPLIEFSTLAAILVVFIAGTEIDIDFLRREKEHIILTVFFEFLILLSLYYYIGWFFQSSYAYVLIAATVASNEVFALVSTNNPTIKGYGVTISVLEDTFAILLLTIGYFSGGSDNFSSSIIFQSISLSVIAIVILFFIAKPFSRLIKSTNNIEAKILLTLLYIFLLTLLSEFIGLPDVLTVFIGAVFLAFYGYDRITIERMSSYMYLALMGFVISLPFQIRGEILLSIFLISALLGIVLSIVAYLIRFSVLSISTILGGLRIDHSLTLSLTLANSGEFGLIVLSTLFLSGFIPIWLVLTAMFSYAFNLTLVSYIVRNLDYFKELIYSKTPIKLLNFLNSISSEMRKMTDELKLDKQFIQGLYQIIILAGFIYLLSAILNILRSTFLSQLTYIGILGVFMVSLYVIFKNVIIRISRKVTTRSIFIIIIELSIFYIVATPVVVSFENIYRRGMLSVFNPLTVILSFLIGGILLELTYFILKNIHLFTKNSS